jgi:hypothetical protein
MGWALRPVTGIEELSRFEEGIAAALDGTTTSVLCQYDRGRCLCSGEECGDGPHGQK